MITREGMETALLMNALLFPGALGHSLIAGAAAGTLLAASGGVDVVTARAPHQPGSVLPGHSGVLVDLCRPARGSMASMSSPRRTSFPTAMRFTGQPSPTGPDGQYGRYFSYLLVAIPLDLAARRDDGGTRPGARSGPAAIRLRVEWSPGRRVRRRVGSNLFGASSITPPGDLPP